MRARTASRSRDSGTPTRRSILGRASLAAGLLIIGASFATPPIALTAQEPSPWNDSRVLDLVDRARTLRNSAVVDLWTPWKRIEFSGWFAWVFWLFAHVYFLIGFRNRIVVLIDCASAYWSSQRYARVVTGIAPGTTDN